MPLPLLAAIPAIAAKAVVATVKAVATTAKVAAKAVTTAVKTTGQALKSAGQGVVKVSKAAVSKLSSGTRTVSAKLKSAGVQVKQRVSTSIQNRVQSKFGDTQKPSMRQIKQALQEKEPRKAEVDTRPQGEMQVQHGEQKKLEIIPAHIYAAVSNGKVNPHAGNEPKPDVAPENQPNAKPRSKGPAMGRAA